VRAIVLVKQVPDLRAAPVGIRPDGTIDREASGAIVNPTDLHALEAALSLADEVWALSMGPPAAEEALRGALAMGATRAVLLCDRLLAGSDTWATANALAAAIAHVGGADLVACGTSALDGETGQVGPEVAARLGLAQATGCDDLAVAATGLVATRTVEGGQERLSLPLPALVTIAETGFTPRYATMVGRRRAARATVERLGAADIGLAADRVGLEASPTKVARMAPVPLPERSCRLVGEDLDYDGLVRALVELGAVGGAEPLRPVVSDGVPEPAPEPQPGSKADPAVWVCCETTDGRLSPASAELLSKATELAAELGTATAAVVLGGETAAAAGDAARYGADVVFEASGPELDPYRCEPHAAVIVSLVRERHPEILLFSATTTGRDLAPRVAALVDTGLAADCVDLAIGAFERRHVRIERLLHQIRPAMAGGMMATCVCPEARPQMATVRPGTFVAALAPKDARRVAVPLMLAPDDQRVTVLDRSVHAAEVSLADADVVVAGGAGCGGENWHLVEELAEAIGGRVAASRGAVEAGLAPRALQVGQTGATLHPRLYVACGISGAMQHVVGIKAARTIVAVNRDPDAYVFRLAHFGAVGDVAEVLPELTAALRRAG